MFELLKLRRGGRCRNRLRCVSSIMKIHEFRESEVGRNFWHVYMTDVNREEGYVCKRKMGMRTEMSEEKGEAVCEK